MITRPFTLHQHPYRQGCGEIEDALSEDKFDRLREFFIDARQKNVMNLDAPPGNLT